MIVVRDMVCRPWQRLINQVTATSAPKADQCHLSEGYAAGIFPSRLTCDEKQKPQTGTHAPSTALDRSLLSSRSCAAVKAEPQVPHLQLLNELVIALGPSLRLRLTLPLAFCTWVVGACVARTARTN